MGGIYHVQFYMPSKNLYDVGCIFVIYERYWFRGVIMIKEQIYMIIREIAEGIDIFDDTPLLDDGILDSISILYMVSELEEKNEIHIPVEEITEDHFKDINSIEAFVNQIMEK